MAKTKEPSRAKSRRSAGRARAENTSPEPKATAEIVRTLIQRFASQEQDASRISVSDFLRLLSLLKELEDEQGIEEIRVKWVEPDKAER